MTPEEAWRDISAHIEEARRHPERDVPRPERRTPRGDAGLRPVPGRRPWEPVPGVDAEVVDTWNGAPTLVLFTASGSRYVGWRATGFGTERPEMSWWIYAPITPEEEASGQFPDGAILHAEGGREVVSVLCADSRIAEYSRWHLGTGISGDALARLLRERHPLLPEAAAGGLRVCAHCGRVCGDYAAPRASATLGGKEEWLCHPSDPSRPDCYRRVTVWSEPLGVLWEGDRPAGVEDIRRSGAGA